MTDLFGGKMIFMQEGDGTLEVEVNDMGGGKYFKIITPVWEFDKISELVEILEKVQKAFEFGGKHE